MPGWFGLVRTNGAVTTSHDGTLLQLNLNIRFTDNAGQCRTGCNGHWQQERELKWRTDDRSLGSAGRCFLATPMGYEVS